MSHYSDDPTMVRVDFWKESGKWYGTEAVKWVGPYWGSENSPCRPEGAPYGKSLRACLMRTDGHLQYAGMRATCLEPYHEHSHPISLIVPEH